MGMRRPYAMRSPRPDFLDEADERRIRAPHSYSTFEAWFFSLSQPRISTYQDLIADPKAGLGRTIRWVWIAAVLSVIAAVVVRDLLFSLGVYEALYLQGYTPEVPVLVLILTSPIAATSGVIAFLLSAAFVHFIATAFGGSGSYSQQAYAMGCYVAPLTILQSAASVTGITAVCLALPLSLYSTVLLLVVVNAVHRIGWGRSIVVVLTFFLSLGLVLGVSFMALSYVAGAS